MTDPAEQSRYALYYAPRADESLARTAAQWLGRNAETGQSRALVPVAGIAYERLAALVADPRLYGFHGTLKAPIALAEGLTERELLDAVGRFAVNQRAIAVPSMVLAEISGFLALVPDRPCMELNDLADQCVVEFDEFRRPADAAELERRRGSGLSQRQDDLLVRWGYPYVLEQWRFHLTLSGRLPDDRERRLVFGELQRRFAGEIDRPLAVRDLCIFRQAGPGRPFSVLARFRLGGGRRLSTQVWQAA